MISKPFLVFGEVLWDVFPDAKTLGGAPLNFSYYFKKQGGNPRVVSAVGKDELGREALERIKSLGIETKCIGEVDYPTGRVNVSITDGNPSFNIVRNSAWEHIPSPPQSLIRSSAGLYLGSVARVSQKNKEVLDKLLEDFSGRMIFVDLNLRPSFFYDKSDIAYLLQKATHLKLNDEEARILRGESLAKGSSDEETARYLIEDYHLQACCITLGDRGAVGGNVQEVISVNGIPAKSGGDSVGCGDAFAGTWFASLLKGKGIKESLERANEIASRVASCRGAIVPLQYFNQL